VTATRGAHNQNNLGPKLVGRQTLNHYIAALTVCEANRSKTSLRADVLDIQVSSIVDGDAFVIAKSARRGFIAPPFVSLGKACSRAWYRRVMLDYPCAGPVWETKFAWKEN
jgi:hypothetical protein